MSRVFFKRRLLRRFRSPFSCGSLVEALLCHTRTLLNMSRSPYRASLIGGDSKKSQTQNVTRYSSYGTSASFSVETAEEYQRQQQRNRYFDVRLLLVHLGFVCCGGQVSVRSHVLKYLDASNCVGASAVIVDRSPIVDADVLDSSNPLHTISRFDCQQPFSKLQFYSVSLSPPLCQLQHL